MAKNGPIILIDDDTEDVDIFKNVLTSTGIKNKLIHCLNGEDAHQLLLTTTEQPLVILSDINMPKMSGIDLLKKIQENAYLKQKSVPFVFFSTSAERGEVRRAYDMTVQGFFVKASTLEELKVQLKLIVDYWTHCVHPQSL